MCVAPDEVSTLAARMRGVATRFRVEYPLSPPAWCAGTYPLATNVGGHPETKILVWFPSPGCFWSLKGGCTMCDFGSNRNGGSVSSALQQFDSLLCQLDSGVRRVHMAPGGSFFSDAEVPPDLRRGAIQKLGRLKFLRSVGVETRPNLLSVSKLMEIVATLPDHVQDLTVGFGLECLNDLVREVAINKGYGPGDVEQAIEVIDTVNAAQNRIRVAFEVYVLLKPLFLSEQEGIDEAIRTIEWAYANGAEPAVLFMNTVKPNTVQGYLASREDLETPIRYEPPYYRSAVQVLKELPLSQRRRTKVLGVQSGIVAEGMPRGCPSCAPFLLGSLMAHNFTRDPAVLDHAANSLCPCKEAWLEELRIPEEDLRSRIYRGLEVLEQAFGN